MARVLIVDDDKSFHELLGTLLREFGGHQTLAAENGAEGLKLVASGEIFDLIITDLRMPLMTGPEMILALRGGGCKVPIILMTGDVNPPAIKGIRVIRKPFHIDYFNDMVVEALLEDVVLRGKVLIF